MTRQKEKEHDLNVENKRKKPGKFAKNQELQIVDINTVMTTTKTAEYSNDSIKPTTEQGLETSKHKPVECANTRVLPEENTKGEWYRRVTTITQENAYAKTLFTRFSTAKGGSNRYVPGSLPKALASASTSLKR